MKLSPFTPLYFDVNSPSDGLPSRFVQVFAPSDQIMIQVIADTNEAEPTAVLMDAHTGDTIDELTWQLWQINTDKVLYFVTLCGLSIGHYKIIIGDLASEEFRVTDDPLVLRKTILIQYRFKDNKQRDDVVSVIDGMEYFFDFRVPGGFKDSGWQFGVNNEQFTTQYEDVVELYSREYTTKNFTMGGSLGVPVWYGEMLNRLLTCSYVYFDGERYTRSDSETPQMQILLDGLDSFVFTQMLRKAMILDPVIEEANQIAIRRVKGTAGGWIVDTNRTTLNNNNEADNFVLLT